MSEHDPSRPPGAPDDRELEAFLSRQSPLSQAYREALPPEKVPDNVDAAVKVWAKREHDQHLGRRGRWWDRAALPVGAAASLILVALLVNKGRESGVSEREAMRQANAASAVSTVQSAPAPVAEAAKPSQAEPAAAAPSPPAPAPKATTPTAASGDLKPVIPRPEAPSQAVSAQASPPPPPQAVISSSPVVPADSDTQMEARQPPASEDRDAVESGIANAPAQRATGMLSSAGSRAMKTEAAPPPPAAAPAPAPAPFPATQAMAKAAPAQTLASQTQLQDCDQMPPGTALDSRSYPAVEAWLAGIRSLRDTNQLEIAQRQMHCWQRAYPQAAVPDDLKALLGQP